MQKLKEAEAFWLRFGHKLARYYHLSEFCRQQIGEREELEIGTIADAESQGLEFCPDCERKMRDGAKSGI